jgi:adenylate kinase
MQAETELGQQAKSYMSQGQLVPDAITIGMLKKKVESNPDKEGYIFDGFPRTIQQAEALDALLSSMGQDISALIALKVSEDEIVKRLLLRGKASGRADDQDESVIRRRIEVYKEETSPVFQYYESFGNAYEVDGLGSIDEIFERLCRTIEDLPH